VRALTSEDLRLTGDGAGRMLEKLPSRATIAGPHGMAGREFDEDALTKV
jgi:hypothetical protein